MVLEEVAAVLVHACPGCGRMVAYGVPRCPACQALADARAHDAHSRRVDSARRARSDPRCAEFYRSRPWRALSARVLSKCGHVCEGCGGLATEVHHDPPIQTPEGWAHRLDPGHLHPLCVACHNEAHGRFGARGGAPGGARDSAGRPGKGTTRDVKRAKTGN